MVRKSKNIHFIGIGGISMSALAILLKSKGCHITGTDDFASKTTTQLAESGIDVFIGLAPNLIDQADIVVYTNAIAETNSDLLYARQQNKTIYERAEFLGKVSSKYKKIFAIAGTHGKTSTTGLLGFVFNKLELDPTIHMGGISENFDSNLVIGKNKYFITEACEYQRSFLKLSPTYSIITNIECDHMDIYKDLNDIESAFYQFAKNTKKAVFVNADNISLSILPKNKKIVTFGLGVQNDYIATNLKNKSGRFSFDVFHKKVKLGRLNLKVLGEHNVLNALACVAVLDTLNFDFMHYAAYFEAYSGIKRRLSMVFKNNSVIHYLDYAHHPTEIKTAIKTINSVSSGRTVVVFQPHTFSRTKALMNEFINCFDAANYLFILPTYAARENYIEGGDATDLFYNISKKINCSYVSNEIALKEELQKVMEENDTVLWLGAGNIDIIADNIIKSLYL